MRIAMLQNCPWRCNTGLCFRMALVGISKALHRRALRRSEGEEHRLTSPFSLIALLETDRGVVPRDGIEPPTLRFSVACSTN